MREKVIEHKLLTEVKKIGGLALKFVSPGYDGVPDRIVLLISSFRSAESLSVSVPTATEYRSIFKCSHFSTTPTGKAQATPQTGVQGVCTGQPSTDWRDN